MPDTIVQSILIRSIPIRYYQDKKSTIKYGFFLLNRCFIIFVDLNKEKKERELCAKWNC